MAPGGTNQCSRRSALWQRNSAPAAIAELPRDAAEQGQGPALQRWRDLPRDQRERTGVDAFVIRADVEPRERPMGSWRTRCGVRRPRPSRRSSVLWLREAGPQGRSPYAHHEQARRRSIQASGVTRVVSIDLHAGPDPGLLQHPFTICLYAAGDDGGLPLKALRRVRWSSSARQTLAVSSARAYSKRLNAGLAIIDKRRERANVSEVHLIGDVKGKSIIIDDMIDTAGTTTGAAKASWTTARSASWRAPRTASLGPCRPAHRRLPRS